MEESIIIDTLGGRRDGERGIVSFHSSPARNAVGRWVTGILIIFTLLGFGFGSWLARLPAVRDHLGASTLEMSVYGLCLAIGSLSGLLLAGRTVALLGSRRALGVGILIQALAMPLAITLIWQELLIPGLALLFCYGFAFATSDVAMNVSGASAERALGKPRLPVMHAGYSLGAVSAMGVGALAETWMVPVPLHLSAVFVIILVVGVFALRLVPPDSETARVDHGPQLAAHTGQLRLPPETAAAQDPAAQASSATHLSRPYTPWRDRRILLVGLVALGMSLAEGTASDWLPLALADGRGIPNSTAALILGIFFVAMTITRTFGSPILSRLGRVPVLRGGAILCGIGVVVVILVPFTWGIVIGALMWGVGCALGFPVGISAAADNPRTAVRDVAAVSAIAYTAMLLGPMAFGFLGEHVGLLTAFWALVAVALLSALAAGAAREPKIHTADH
ncbi:MFS transporter [Leucobacter insecticola]|uniref:MFS transporter n=2 Tax=Leucobacter insecticola TaxID=2714934 RepID=A0A6G8FLV6_9MICO|nr:MFS transporter [Leucobacter insecticola]